MGMSIDKHIGVIEDLKSTMSACMPEPEKTEICTSLSEAIETMRKYQQLEDFAKWVAIEVIDEELWTYNYLAFAELACRKLVQLGIMQESDGEYTYEVVEDGKRG